MSDIKNDKKNIEVCEFSAQIDKVLDIVINSIYTKNEIFLRELISNASDACDKLRYLSQTDASLMKNSEEFQVNILFDKEKKLLAVIDNGIGMNREDLHKHLGSIASSGTQKFLEALSKEKQKESEMIGKFGVGFYASFMVADSVYVITKKAGEDGVYQWHSKADGKYEISSCELDSNFDKLPGVDLNDYIRNSGSAVILHLKDDQLEYLDRFRIEHIVKNYSNNINVPIYLQDLKQEKKSDQTNKESKEDSKEGEIKTKINDMDALWKKSKSDITEEEYQNFYKQISFDPTKPWLTLHNKHEGSVEFTSLLFIPSAPTFDLYNADRKSRVKLYIKKIFIGDENLDIVPSYLRFLRGVIDSEDLPLNISRESLQHNNVLDKIKSTIVKKILQEFQKQKNKSYDEYLNFWKNFGPVIKEGLCEMDFSGNIEKIMDICLFESAIENQKISLQEYIDKKAEGQSKVIYYLSGENLEALKKNPQIEGFLNKNIDVLLFMDTVDDFWVSTNNKYKDFEFKSVTRSDIDLENDKIDENSNSEGEDTNKDKEKEKENLSTSEKELLEFFTKNLENIVKEVQISKKLYSSPACLTVDNTAMDIRMERYLIEQKQLKSKALKILEINIKHPILEKISKKLEIIKDMKDQNAKDAQNNILKDMVYSLYYQAAILEGEKPNDPTDFASRINNILLSV